MFNSLIKKKSFLITSLLILIGVLVTMLNLLPNDYWWHFKAGEYMVKNKTIPFTDVFSWYGIENNLYWYSHEWLSEIVIYLTKNKVGVTIFVSFCLSTLFIILYKTNKEEYEKHFGFTLLWIITGALLLSKMISPRPHMISFILFSITIWLLYDLRKNEQSKKIWFLPLVSLAWVNFHGGSSNLPYVLVFMFIITGLVDFNIGKLKFDKLTKKQIKTYVIIGILSFLVLIINPHGMEMISYPYINMNDSVMLSFIGEWRSPNIKNFIDILFILPIIIPFILFILSKKDILFIDLILIGAFSYLTLKSIRFSAFLYIVDSYIVFRYLGESIDIKNKLWSDIKNVMPNALIKTYLSIIMISLILSIMIIIDNPIKDIFTKDIISSEVINIIKKENPQKLYNDYNYGGYLIYNDIKPMIDGRADMYSKTLLKDYISFKTTLNPEFLKRYEFDYFLVDKNLVLDNAFKLDNQNYKLLAEDKRSVLYKNLKYKQ